MAAAADKSAASCLGPAAEIITADAVTMALSRGVVMGDGKGGIGHAPMGLLPFKFDRKMFELAQSMALPFNKLVDAVARDTAWLEAELAETGAADAFTGKLMEIFRAVNKEGVAQPLALGVLRSDYMVDDPEQSGAAEPRLLQVELNTISSAFGGLSTTLSGVHRAVLERHAPGSAALADFLAMPSLADAESEEGRAELDASLPKQDATAGIARAMAAAVDAYKKGRGFGSTDAAAARNVVVAFIVQPGDTNSTDQRALQFRLWDEHRIPVLRVSLDQLQTHGDLDETSRVFTIPRFLDADKGDGAATGGAGGAGGAAAGGSERVEVALAYYRAGYTPRDYKTETAWQGRLKMERSMAIKCPNIAYHLAGTKKVQQALAAPGVVERFVSPGEANLLRLSFAGLWSLDKTTEEGGSEDPAALAKVIADATAAPQRFVLKPQREGGGNNYYGEAVKTELARMGAEERAGYILMQRIFPQLQEALLVKGGKITVASCLSELGLFSTYLGGPDGEALVSEQVGHLVRTKPLGVDEGGVAAGFAVLSTPILR